MDVKRFQKMKFPIALLLLIAAAATADPQPNELILRFSLVTPTYQICIPFGTSTTLTFIQSVDWGDSQWQATSQSSAPAAAASLPTVTCFGSRQTRGLAYTYSSRIPAGTQVDVTIRFRSSPPTFPQFGFVYNESATRPVDFCDGSWERAGAHVELRAIVHWDTTFFRPQSMDCAFAGAGLLTLLPQQVDALPNSVRSLRATFFDARAFNDNSVARWRVQSVTSMDYMFFNARAFGHSLRRWCGGALPPGRAPEQFAGGFDASKITPDRAPDWSNRDC
eukprot:TRINITY_DN8472_c0_g1_i1.p1 TRINITY_DN8472_c0_g1~~TRINITY_DN8472_c0_g1_i1.p1  ORF type:complete len:278 (+),score=15.60 TRINITY_DN8472_c0_g1_i1:135-968(+)